MRAPSFRHLVCCCLVALTIPAVAGPDITLTVPAPGASVSSLTSVSITFSEPVTGVTASDLGINGEPAAAVSGSGAGPYVFAFPQPAPGTVTFGWDPDQSISGIGTGIFEPVGGWSVTLTDTAPPTLGRILTSQPGQEMTDVVPSPGAVCGAVSQSTVTFSEPVAGVDAADLLVNGSPAATVTGELAGPYVFTFAAAPSGPVAFTWAAAHGIADTAGNAFAGTGWNASVGSPGTVVITEFLADNGGAAVMAGSDTDGVRDENWDLSPWIELHNPGPDAVDLRGWSLTDDPAVPRRWVFPARTLAAGARLVVFASGKDRKPAAGNLHTNFTLGEAGGSLALFRPDAPAGAPASAWIDYPPQRHDFSYGAQTTDGAPRYFSPPSVTQGAYTLPNSDGIVGTVPPAPSGVANGSSTLTGITPDPAPSVARGFFDAPFSVILSCRDATAAIRYTLDGSVPLASSPLYTAPLTVSGTTLLRMAAFGANKVPSRVVTHTWLFADGVFAQPSPPYDNPALTTDNTNPQPPAPGGSPLPIAWGTNSNFTAAQTIVGFPTGTATGANNLTAGQIPADYGMDPKVWADPARYNDSGAVDPVNGITNRDRIRRALRTLPALSVVMRSADMFGAYPNGTTAPGTVDPLYPTSLAGVKRDMTKPCSMEMLSADGSTLFTIDCGIDLHGNASRDPHKNPKHGFTIRFRGRYGAGKLRGELFPDSPVREWNKLILRGDFGGSWLHWSGTDTLTAGNDGSQRPRGIRLREAFCKDTFRDMGRAASHHRFCNLFINGVCWGSYELMEDQAEDYGASYFGGTEDDYDVVDQGKLKSGSWTAWSAMKNLLGWTGGSPATDRGTPPSATVYQSAFTNAQYEQLRTFLDLPWFQDYMIHHLYFGHRDWATAAGDAAPYMKNVYFIRPKNGTFKTMPWDMENLMWHQDEDRVTGMTTFTGSPTLLPPAAIHPRVRNNSEYRLEFADRAWRHLVRPGGALTPSVITARLARWTAVLGPDGICLESARWGDYRQKVHAYSAGTFNQVYTWNGAWHDNTTSAQFNGTWAAGTQRFNTGRVAAAALGTWNTAMTNSWWDEIRRLNTAYFPVRAANLLTQFRNNGLYPVLNAPELRLDAAGTLVADGPVPAGTLVRLALPTAPAGTSSSGDIWFTTDGTDPRPAYDLTGTPRPGAVRYTSPFAVTQPVVVRARTLAAAASFPAKPPVRAASAGTNLILTYTPAGGTSGRGAITAAPRVLDGLTLAAGDRILLKNQGTAAQNGIWVVTTPGTGADGVWDRAADWDADGEVATGTWVRVTAGTLNENTAWRVTNTGTITVGGAAGTAVAFSTQPFTPWSALMEFTLTTGAPRPTVVISELNYNPRNNQGGSAAEFIEFHNHGTLAVDMTSWSMEGVDYVFPAGFTLAPGQRAVIASNDNPALFASQFPGVVVLGWYGGNLSNGGERVSLLDRAGTVVHSVEYGDASPWPTAPDNGGYSLELVDPLGDPLSPANWQASAALKGSPGLANSAPAPASVVISEFYATGGRTRPVGAPPDFVEVENTGTTTVDLSGWSIDGHAFAPGLLAPGGRAARTLPAPLNADGGRLALLDAAGRTADALRYGPQIPEAGFSRTAGGWRLAPPSPGSAPTTLTTVQSPAALRINELMARPGPDDVDWIEFWNTHATSPVVLTGCWLERGDGQLVRIDVPAAVGPQAAAWFICDPGGRSGRELNLALPAEGAALTLRDPAWAVVQSVSWGPQAEDVSIGVLAGSPALVPLTYPSPGLPNLEPPALRPLLNEVLVINRSGDNTPRATREPWVEIRNPLASPVDLSGWSLRTIVAAGTPHAFTFPAGTTLAPGAHLALWSGDTGFAFDTIDWVHHGFLLLDPAGQTMDRIAWGRQIPDKSIGRLPDGTWALLSAPTRGAPNAGAHALAPFASLALNEWQAAAPGDTGEFIEFFNADARPAALGGLWLGDSPSEAGRRRQRIPALTFIAPGGHFVMRPAGQRSGTWPDGTPSHPASYQFRLPPDGSLLRLGQDDGAVSAIDAVNFGPAPLPPSSGGRVTDGNATLGTLIASPGWPNGSGPLPHFTVQPDDIVVPLGQPFTLAAVPQLTDSARWQRNGIDLAAPAPPGPDGAPLVRTAAAFADDGLYTCLATNSQGTTASRTVRVTVIFNYALWAASWGVGGMGADPDGDGLANGLEFMAGTSPLALPGAAERAAVAADGGFHQGPGGDFLTMDITVNPRAAFRSVGGELSPDLSLWQPQAASDWQTLETRPDGSERRRARFAVPPGTARRFLRLRLDP